MEKSNQHIDNHALWKGLRRGDEDCFRRLFESQYSILMSFGLKIIMNQELVKDVIQELFLELWNKKYQLPDVENINAYLIQILKRKILKKISKKNKTSLPHTIEQKTSSYETLLIQQQQNDAIQSRLKNALQQLTAKQKEIIQLRFFEGLSYEEIATKMTTKKRTVYNQVHSAIKSLKDSMLMLL